MALSLRTIFGDRARTKRKASRVKKRLRFESLESRLALSTLTVGPDAKDDFHTIQSAVDAASAGDTIKVDPGVYVEQVSIAGAGKNNIRLVGSDQKSIIKAPPVLTGDRAIVEVDGSQIVTIDKFTISGGAVATSCADAFSGVRVIGGGSANISDNHITGIRDSDPALGGCQVGNAIQVGRQFEGQTGSAAISHNTIDNYQKTGIVVDNTGSSAQIDHNTITGIGPTNVIAQNGIQISRGATAQVEHNSVSGNVYTGNPLDAYSVGILLYQAGDVAVTHNAVFSNDVGIESDFATSGAISQNDSYDNTLNGIVLYSTSGTSVSQNTTNHNGSNNVAYGSGDAGIGLFSSSGNAIDKNTSNDNNGDGIFVDANSTGNKLTQNKLKGNTNFDAEDQSVTGNTWTKNKGKTSMPPGLVS